MLLPWPQSEPISDPDGLRLAGRVPSSSVPGLHFWFGDRAEAFVHTANADAAKKMPGGDSRSCGRERPYKALGQGARADRSESHPQAPLASRAPRYILPTGR